MTDSTADITRPSRRLFLGGLAALAVAPAIVRAESLMPVKPVDLYDTRALIFYDAAWDELRLRVDRSLQTMKRPSRGAWVIPDYVAKKLMPATAFTLQPPAGTQRYMERLIAPHELVAINYSLWGREIRAS